MFSHVSKKVKITFWVSTILIAAMNISSVFFVNMPVTIQTFEHLGVGATWFRYELEIAKTLAGLVLILPFIRGKVKEWAYVGLGIDFISALIAIWAIDGAAKGLTILPAIALLAISYWSYHALHKEKILLI